MVTGTLQHAFIPPYDKMLWPTLLAIKALGDSGSNQEIEDRAIEFAGYSESQLGVLHGEGPQTEIRYRMAWTRTYLKAVGALENSSRGVWSITEYGQTLVEEDLADIPSRVRAQFPRKSAKGESKVNHTERLDLPESSEVSVFTSTVFEEWRDHLLDVVQSMTPAAFEKLCQRVLRESGFTRVEVTGRSGDGGIDGIGVLRIALLSFHVFFQCKRYKGSVGAAAIRDFPRGDGWTDRQGFIHHNGKFHSGRQARGDEGWGSSARSHRRRNSLYAPEGIGPWSKHAAGRRSRH